LDAPLQAENKAAVFSLYQYTCTVATGPLASSPFGEPHGDADSESAPQLSP
jgi:hypothetical protein